MDPNNDVTEVEQVSNQNIVSVPIVPAKPGENVSTTQNSSDTQALSTSEEPLVRRTLKKRSSMQTMTMVV